MGEIFLLRRCCRQAFDGFEITRGDKGGRAVRFRFIVDQCHESAGALKREDDLTLLCQCLHDSRF